MNKIIVPEKMPLPHPAFGKKNPRTSTFVRAIRVPALCLVLCTLYIAPAVAQETLTLEQCRQMALANNRRIAMADKKIEGAAWIVRTYRANFLPNFSLQGTGIYGTGDGSLAIAGGNLPVLAPNAAGTLAPNGSYAYFPGLNLDYKIGLIYNAGIQVKQPLYMGGKIRAAYRMAQLGHEAAGISRQLTETEVIVSTDEAYMLAVKAKEMKVVAEKYREVLNELLGNVQSAYRHGLKPQNDVLKVQVKLNESELALRKAENAFRLATMNLCHTIGRPLDASTDVSNDFPTVERVATPPTADVSTRPETALLEKQVDVATQQVKLSHSEMLPQVGVQGNFGYTHGFEVNSEPLFDKASFTALLSVSVPLFHFGEHTSKVRAAKLKLEEARLEQLDKTELMQLELAQADNNLDEAHLECELADKSLEQAAENMRLSTQQYKAGLEPLSDCLEAQALWQSASATRVDAYFQRYLCHVKYLKAAGRLAVK